MKKKILQATKEPFADIALDTININKQALIFVHSKKSAESAAEKIAKRLKPDEKCEALADKILNVLEHPTKQCEKLSSAAKKSIAFHHAGLHAKQRELIEDAFRTGEIKIICCTPTLAAGVDLPAFRTILKDLKRYNGRWGMDWISNLEYQQMSGRAGRPGKEDFGESIAIAASDADKANIYDRYITGEVEDIYSKLAVEPVLRTYVLSMIAIEFVRTTTELHDFFSKTFWAKQYGNVHKLHKTIDKMLALLQDFGFVDSNKDDFVSADSIGDEKLHATPIGKRIAELYIDPLTAYNIIIGLKKAGKTATPFQLLHLISSQLEMRPLVRVKSKDYEKVSEVLANETLLASEPDVYNPEYHDFLDSIRNSMFINDWIEEKTEEYVLEEYNVRPGEIRAKTEIADWLLYSAEEIARMQKQQELLHEITKLRLRVQNGVKEELLALLQLKGIGRVRSRMLFRNKIRNLKDIKNTGLETLSGIIGRKTAESIKQQVEGPKNKSDETLSSFQEEE